MYHCISLQHHHRGHKISYGDLLLHNWSTLIAWILPQYIQHCPGVRVHFPDQSRHCCRRLLLMEENEQQSMAIGTYIFHQECIVTRESELQTPGNVTIRRESKLPTGHFCIRCSPGIITHCPPLTFIAHLHSAFSRNGSTIEP